MVDGKLAKYESDDEENESKKPTEEFKRGSSDERILKKRGYELTQLLGEGAYAKVYMADYKGKGKTLKLACKYINGNLAPRDFLRRFFPREIDIMSKVNHVNVIRIHSVLQRKMRYFVFMQYCEHGDLLDFIKGHGCIRERQARVWFMQALKGLHYLNQMSIAHRDLKCENLLLTAGYNIKISDFGFARYLIPGEATSDTFCGSLAYAPPEIIRGIPYDPRAADVWSLGVVLFVMLNKTLPFDDQSLKRMYDGQMQRLWKLRTKVAQVLSQDAKDFQYVILDPNPLSRLYPMDLWRQPWIQSTSQTELEISPARPKRKWIKGLGFRRKGEGAPGATESESETKPLQIMDADTSILQSIENSMMALKDRVNSETTPPPAVPGPSGKSVATGNKALPQMAKSMFTVPKTPPSGKSVGTVTKTLPKIGMSASSGGKKPVPALNKVNQPSALQTLTDARKEVEQEDGARAERSMSVMDFIAQTREPIEEPKSESKPQSSRKSESRPK